MSHVHGVGYSAVTLPGELLGADRESRFRPPQGAMFASEPNGDVTVYVTSSLEETRRLVSNALTAGPRTLCKVLQGVIAYGASPSDALRLDISNGELKLIVPANADDLADLFLDRIITFATKIGCTVEKSTTALSEPPELSRETSTQLSNAFVWLNNMLMILRNDSSKSYALASKAGSIKHLYYALLESCASVYECKNILDRSVIDKFEGTEKWLDLVDTWGTKCRGNALQQIANCIRAFAVQLGRNSSSQKLLRGKTISSKNLLDLLKTVRLIPTQVEVPGPKGKMRAVTKKVAVAIDPSKPHEVRHLVKPERSEVKGCLPNSSELLMGIQKYDELDPGYKNLIYSNLKYELSSARLAVEKPYFTFRRSIRARFYAVPKVCEKVKRQLDGWDDSFFETVSDFPTVMRERTKIDLDDVPEKDKIFFSSTYAINEIKRLWTKEVCESYLNHLKEALRLIDEAILSQSRLG